MQSWNFVCPCRSQGHLVKVKVISRSNLVKMQIIEFYTLFGLDSTYSFEILFVASPETIYCPCQCQGHVIKVKVISRSNLVKMQNNEFCTLFGLDSTYSLEILFVASPKVVCCPCRCQGHLVKVKVTGEDLLNIFFVSFYCKHALGLWTCIVGWECRPVVC